MNTPNFTQVQTALSSPFERFGPAAAILSATGALQTVWARLEYNFPLVKYFSESVAWARRKGEFQYIISTDPRFLELQFTYGPHDQRLWELLGVAAVYAATGVVVEPARLYEGGSGFEVRPGSYASRAGDALRRQDKEEVQDG